MIDSLCPTCGNKKLSENNLNWKTNDCICYEQFSLKEKYTIANIPTVFWYETINSFSLQYQEFSTKYINSFDIIKKNNTGVFLYSEADTALITPSFVGVIILKELLKKGYTGRYISFDNFLIEMSKNFLLNTDLLVIDLINLFDIDRLENNNYYKLMNMLNYRKAPIIFTSQEPLTPMQNKWNKLISFYVRTKAVQLKVPDFSLNLSMSKTNLNDIFEDNGLCLKKIQ